MKDQFIEVLEKAIAKKKKGTPFVIATVVQAEAQSPARTGFKLIFFSDGNFLGTVGGGELERLVLQKCEELLQTEDNAFLEFQLTDDESGIGMACGGQAKVFFEYFGTDKKVYLFGAGHLCKSTVPLLNSLGFSCIVIDNRAEFAQAEKIPEASEIYNRDYLEFLQQTNFQRNDAIIIFTHNHSFDHQILNFLAEKKINVKYIGMIGSKSKVQGTLAYIKKNGYELPKNLYAPIGLNIGKTTTSEISLAIAAEILAVFNNVKNINFLKDKFKGQKK